MSALTSFYGILLSTPEALHSSIEAVVFAQEQPLPAINTSAEESFDNFFNTSLGSFLFDLSRYIGIGVLLLTIYKVATKSMSGRGGHGGVGQTLKPLIAAFVIAALLFNVKWPIGIMQLFVVLIGWVITSAAELLFGFSDTGPSHITPFDDDIHTPTGT